MNEQEERSLNRRRFLKRFAGGLCLLGGLWTLTEPLLISLEEQTISLTDLAKAFDGFKIALLSDTHCGPFTTPSFVQKAVDLANEANPDVVLLLGDFCHRHKKYIGPGIEPFANLKATSGVYAVLGNHDHWESESLTRKELKRAGVNVLLNKSVTLSKAGEKLSIGGVDDLWEGRQDLRSTFRGVKKETTKILMSHNPDYAERLYFDGKISLMVSGHTHGGQVRLPFIGAPILPVRTGQKYCAGLAKGPDCLVYTSRGVGTITPPVRFRCRPEVSLLTLVGRNS